MAEANNVDFQSIMREMLMEEAKDANGQQILIDGQPANYLQVLCKQILNKSFKDANIAKWVLVKAGVVEDTDPSNDLLGQLYFEKD